MRNLNTYLMAVSLVLSSLLYSCAKEEELSSQSVISTDSHTARTAELDQWIDEHFTKPYNIEVIYHWDRNLAGATSYAYPPQEDNVRLVLESTLELWLNIYEQTEGIGKNFLQGKLPLKIYLFGGKGLDASGLELLASPKSSAVELYIYDVNTFNPKNPDRRYALARSLQHQFVRRLTDIIPYDRDTFYTISKDKYLSSPDLLVTLMQQDRSHKQRFGMRLAANREGFSTLYAMLSPEVDFAETFSSYLCHTPQEIREALTRAATPIVDAHDPLQSARNAEAAQVAHAQLQAKIKFIEQYCRKNLGISIQELQMRSLSAIAQQ